MVFLTYAHTDYLNIDITNWSRDMWPSNAQSKNGNRYGKQLQLVQSWKFESLKIHITIIKP